MAATEFLDGKVLLHAGDCIEALAAMPENSVDACVSDPPYHLTSIVRRWGGDLPPRTEATIGKHAYGRHVTGFMNKAWDGGDIAFQVATWQAVYRVLKPGAYILAFASTRGFAEMSVAIKGAGFVTHPMLDYLVAHPEVQQFIDILSAKQADAFLRLLDHNDIGGMLAWTFGGGFPKATRIAAEGYDGFRYGGQALKPAIEPIFMGQKPFSEATGTANILRHGTGAINIDGCRIFTDDDVERTRNVAFGLLHRGREKTGGAPGISEPSVGRWPANLIHDGSAEVLAAFPETSSGEFLPHHKAKGKAQIGTFDIRDRTGEKHPTYGDSGSAARFFYSSKADADDRIGSKHPTVKPVDLMRYLVRLVTPPAGTVIDPFAGTGTTGEAAWREGMKAILIEREPEYQADIAERMRLCLAGPGEKRREIIKRKGLGNADAGPLFGGAS